MAAPHSPHTFFMSWVYELRGTWPSEDENAHSEFEEEEVLKLLLPDRIFPSPGFSPEPQHQQRLSSSQASPSVAQLSPTSPNRIPSRGSADRKGKQKANEDDFHDDRKNAKKPNKKRKRSETCNDEIDAGGSGPKAQSSRKVKGRSTAKRAPSSTAATTGAERKTRNQITQHNVFERSVSSLTSSSPSLLSLPTPHSRLVTSLVHATHTKNPENAATGADQDIPHVKISPVDIEEYNVYMGEDDIHSSDSEPGGFLTNGRRRRRELERSRPRDANLPVVPLPASTIRVNSDLPTAAYFLRPPEKRWMSREFCQSIGPVTSEGVHGRPPQFPDYRRIKEGQGRLLAQRDTENKNSVFLKRKAYIDSQ